MTRALAELSCSRRKCLLLLPLLVGPAAVAAPAELTLAANGRSDYQIVLPDAAPTPAMGECLSQTARLIRIAFEANGFEVPIVAEAKRDPSRPAIFLADTRYARANGVDPDRLRDWSYVLRAVGRDVILAGNDRPARAETTDPRRPNWDRIGTAKAVVDFARQFLGVRFLYPEIAPYSPVSSASKVDLLASPAIEFLPTPRLTVPGNLNVEKTPLLRLNTAHPAGGGFYDLALNRFPRVDEMFASHTWERAVPPEQYAVTHPEYFALVNGERLKPESGHAQYCLSNSEVQELIYRDLASWLDRGFASVDLGQPDGFRECQCEPCAKLFGTGADWSEKIWIFNRNVAGRLQQSHPGRQVTMMSYILTAAPPKTFNKFPANTCVMLTGTNEEDIAPWRGYEVPRGFSGYVYNWCPNLGSRYTPMRTPAYVEAQVRRLAANRIQAMYRDGPGQLFGLEAPVYYVMGRMFDDPEHNRAEDLLGEFCGAAFGKAAPSMRSFYDQLYHAIALYSDHIGTRCHAWTYPALDGRRRKTVTDPFQLLGFLYTPRLLAALEADLLQAERLAATSKAGTRLALVRREFEYLRHLARVVHLDHAFEIQPDASSRDRLLDAIDARNAFIESLYLKRAQPAFAGDWAYVLFPFGGHNANHLRLAYDGYQEPYANTCLNWDTRAMRNAPVPGRKRLAVGRVQPPPTLDAPAWRQTAAHELISVHPGEQQPCRTRLQVLSDAGNLYVRLECELEPGPASSFPALGRDRDLRGEESVDIYLAPDPGSGIAYRFMVGANASSRYDAVNGLIADPMDPRHGRDDPTWNGEWRADSRVDAASHRWSVLVAIPFETITANAPGAGAVWRGNFARHHRSPGGRTVHTLWSSSYSSSNMDDPGLFGEIVFENPGAKR